MTVSTTYPLFKFLSSKQKINYSTGKKRKLSAKSKKLKAKSKKQKATSKGKSKAKAKATSKISNPSSLVSIIQHYTPNYSPLLVRALIFRTPPTGPLAFSPPDDDAVVVPDTPRTLADAFRGLIVVVVNIVVVVVVVTAE